MSTTIDPDTREETLTPPETGVTCPSCGTAAAPGQLMCLECGERLALGYKRPPTWRLPAAIAGVIVLLAGAAVAFALAQATNDAGKTAANAPTQTVSNAAPADTPPTQSQPAPAPAATSTAAAPAGATGASGTAGAATTPTTTTAPASGETTWPDGKSGYTVILASLPSKKDAETKLKAAQTAGISTVGLLHSDDFATLRAGYWVVFDGQFGTSDQASTQAEQDRGKGDFKDAYPRYVSQSR